MNQAEPETGGDSDGRTRQETINDIVPEGVDAETREAVVGR